MVKQASQRGFTLVELLIVISIIGILAGFLFVNFANVRERGRDSRRKHDLSEVKTALRLYYNDYQSYPSSTNNLIVGCGPDGDSLSTCAWGDSFAIGSTVFMELPIDPVNAGQYSYQYAQTEGGENFLLQAYLENLSDPQSAESQTKCGIAEDDQIEGLFVVCAQ